MHLNSLGFVWQKIGHGPEIMEPSLITEKSLPIYYEYWVSRKHGPSRKWLLLYLQNSWFIYSIISNIFVPTEYHRSVMFYRFFFFFSATTKQNEPQKLILSIAFKNCIFIFGYFAYIILFIAILSNSIVLNQMNN